MEKKNPLYIHIQNTDLQQSENVFWWEVGVFAQLVHVVRVVVDPGPILETPGLRCEYTQDESCQSVTKHPAYTHEYTQTHTHPPNHPPTHTYNSQSTY